MAILKFKINSEGVSNINMFLELFFNYDSLNSSDKLISAKKEWMNWWVFDLETGLLDLNYSFIITLVDEFDIEMEDLDSIAKFLFIDGKIYSFKLGHDMVNSMERSKVCNALSSNFRKTRMYQPY